MVHGPITPNHLTTARLVTGVAACAALAVGVHSWTIWGGVLWLVSAFLDRADGELARLGGKTSPGGHAYDFACDVGVNSLFFLAIGIGLRDDSLGWWAIPLGLAATVGIAGASILSERLEEQWTNGQKAYAGIAGFDFDDVLYLFAPAAWLGWLLPLLVGASVGGPAFLIWTWLRLRHAR
jgi:phosphatidylglycerophosphate synthase